jgi:YfiH family protein
LLEVWDLILVNKNGASFFQFENLAKIPAIRHGIFTRQSGHSTGPFQSLNVSFGLGDADENVTNNRRVIAQVIECDDLVFLEQVHGDQVVIFNRKNSVYPKAALQVLGVGDAIVTDVCGKFLTTQLADCQSVLLYDPIQRVVANVHSGWRGSIKNILGRTLGDMKKHFQCNSVHIIAGIGPSLGPCCAEFVNYRTEIPEQFWQYKTAADHFDFWAMSCDQLTHAGVLEKNIEIANTCTKCNLELFFSYRGEGQTGRFAAAIGLKRSTSVPTAAEPNR